VYWGLVIGVLGIGNRRSFFTRRSHSEEGPKVAVFGESQFERKEAAAQLDTVPPLEKIL